MDEGGGFLVDDIVDSNKNRHKPPAISTIMAVICSEK